MHSEGFFLTRREITGELVGGRGVLIAAEAQGGEKVGTHCLSDEEASVSRAQTTENLMIKPSKKTQYFNSLNHNLGS